MNTKERKLRKIIREELKRQLNENKGVTGKMTRPLLKNKTKISFTPVGIKWSPNPGEDGEVTLYFDGKEIARFDYIAAWSGPGKPEYPVIKVKSKADDKLLIKALYTLIEEL